MAQKVKNSDYALADVGERFLAILIDGIVLALIGGLLFGSMGNAGGGLWLLINVAYHWFFWTRQDGQTPGKRAMKLRVVKEDGSELRDVDALIRAVGYNVSGFFGGLGYLWAIFDSKQRTWHDLLAKTIVIKA